MMGLMNTVNAGLGARGPWPQLTFYDRTKGKLVDFIPLVADQVGMYVCGPTVYGYAHIGNARSVVVFDCWYRLFCQYFSKVTYARNITDLDDKEQYMDEENVESIESMYEEPDHYRNGESMQAPKASMVLPSVSHEAGYASGSEHLDC